MYATSWRKLALASLALVAVGTSHAEAQIVGGVIGGRVGGPVGIAGLGGVNPVAGAALRTGAFGGIGLPIVNPYTQAGLNAAMLNPNIATNPFANPAIDAIAGTPAYVNPYSPYGGGFGFGFGMWNPVAGFLRGVADVTTANAQAQVTLQRSRLLNEMALRSQIDTRRMLIEQARWERMNTPGAEDVRLYEMEMALARSRRNPPVGEIWSGKALNVLLRHLIDQLGKGNRGPLVALDENILSKVNVTDGTGGNPGLLKGAGRLPWPGSLQGADFTPLREVIDTKFPEAVKSLGFGQPVEKSALDDIKAALKGANQKLDDTIARLTPTDYLEAKRFLNQLDEAVRALQNPNASNYFTGKWAAKANTVGDLVKQMADNGLQFAPATPGAEAAYRALYYALASYDASMPALTASQPMQPQTPPR